MKIENCPPVLSSGSKEKLKIERTGFAPLETARPKPLRGAQAWARSLTGFTAVELLITLGLFIIIITATITIFVRAIASEKLITEAVKLNDNVSLALEQASREIRTGYDFCAASCNSGSVNFKNVFNQDVEYRLGSGSDAGKLVRVVGGTPEPITADDVEVSEFAVNILNEPLEQQPRVTIMLQAKIRGSAAETLLPVRIETTVSSRNPKE